ncbi:uncharacterized protein BP5553_09579 [Venustampulla echinocandica]|uniref:HTH araC/xylS-type domain-containing protein n=1 Tax=Venustampulla echinocandica TaxID=2656787 RepID=A0A370TBE8_9HELO|nr:uncharacterized protein BP5553_09579 [Venustampulla echinocandica]RDL31370.1 hypothetical protein BP5553_09579 [Venustampulla echinocandica]
MAQSSRNPSFSTPSSRWAALVTRNPAATNSFVYSVTTTNIYCRADCPSRLARRANVKFYESAIEAEREGFRACKRCRPEVGNGVERDPQVLAVQKAKKLIEDEGRCEEKKWTVKDLAKEVGLTESHFCRVFKKVTGMRVGEYRTFVRGNRDAVNAVTRKGSDIGDGRMEELNEMVSPLLSGPTQPWDLDLDTIEMIESDKDMEMFDFANYRFDFPTKNTLNLSIGQSDEDCFEFLDFDFEDPGKHVV